MNGNKYITEFTIIFFMISLFFSIPDSLLADQKVRPGDTVLVNYTCCLKSGEIIATTDTGVADDVSRPKSHLFLKKPEYGPVQLTAGEAGTKLQPGQVLLFDFELEASLSKAVINQPVGSSREVAVEPFSRHEPGGAENTIQLARVRHRTKEMRISPGDYLLRTRKEAAIGQDFTIDDTVPGKVEEITENEVVIRFHGTHGAQVETPFGKGVIHDRGDHYEIVLQAKKGDMVRSGPLIGRLIDLDERSVTIDYGNPFGGEKLMCEITVEQYLPEQGDFNK
ncbi:MAG: hypothetical protein U9R43_10405 [Thermodesulfobacteriota bacterium]|nr:hypothetical protein [Thermodesulfobacteriota bacterium]